MALSLREQPAPVDRCGEEKKGEDPLRQGGTGDHLAIVVGWVATVVMISFLAILILEVLMRKLFSRSLFGAYEVSGFLLIWISMLGGYLAYRGGEFVRLTLFLNILPAGLARKIEKAKQFVVMLLLAFLSVSGFMFVFSPAVMRQRSTAFHIPTVVGYLPIPLAFLLMIVASVEILYRRNSLRR
ncbi:MAG: TRAP transporter small permease [Thermoanaerobacteraceae bacterium]|nr:TRAP transporter small permease [Thermoanaerobacteraceae bacterium]